MLDKRRGGCGTRYFLQERGDPGPSLPSFTQRESSMATSQEDGALGVDETSSEVGNGISAMLALSEQVMVISVFRRFRTAPDCQPETRPTPYAVQQ